MNFSSKDFDKLALPLMVSGFSGNELPISSGKEKNILKKINFRKIFKSHFTASKKTQF